MFAISSVFYSSDQWTCFSLFVKQKTSFCVSLVFWYISNDREHTRFVVLVLFEMMACVTLHNIGLRRQDFGNPESYIEVFMFLSLVANNLIFRNILVGLIHNLFKDTTTLGRG